MHAEATTTIRPPANEPRLDDMLRAWGLRHAPFHAAANHEKNEAIFPSANRQEILARIFHTATRHPANGSG